MRKFVTSVILLILCVVTQAAEVIVTVDREEVEENETFNVVFTYKGELDGDPDFTTLEKDFQIVSQNRRSNLQVLNNTYNYELSWVITLLPRRAGQLEIPSIEFDQERSVAQSITVTAAAPEKQGDLGDIFLESELTPDSGYVQGQYLFTVRIFFRGWLVDGELTDPDIGTQDVVVQALGEPRRYSKFRNGERYQVYERRHALFPQSSGEMTLAPTYFSGRLRLPSGRNMLKRITLDGITTTVKPAPASYTGSVWLPAINLELSEIWPTDTLVFEQGVPITRTFTVKATGLSSAQLPQLQLDAHDQVRSYPDQPATEDRLVDDGVMGVRTESVALVPQVAGDVTLPAVELVWWDTKNNRQQIARVPERVITVAASSLAAANPTLAVTETMVTGKTSWSSLSNPWIWATALCALGWLVTLARRPSVRSDNTDYNSPHEDSLSLHQVRNALAGACRENQAARSRELFVDYAKALLGTDSVPGVDEIERHFGHDLAEQYRLLSRTLYGPDAGESWTEGWKFLKLIEAMPKTLTPSVAKPEVLQPL